MKSIATSLDLAEVRSMSRAFVFIYVNWAIEARHSETAFRNLLTVLPSPEQGFSIPVYRVDLSEQEGEVWTALRQWLREDGQPYDQLTYGGYGALLWIRSGAAVASVPHVAGVEQSKLVAVTKSIFE